MIDPHAHLDDPRFDGDREEVIRRMAESGVQAVVTVGCGRASSEDCLALAERHGGVWAAAAVHPHQAGEYDAKADPEWLASMMRHPRVVAWGEIGLDYHYDFAPRDLQRHVFAEQLDAALAADKPVILHVREAHGDAYALLKERRGRLRGVLHCYSGSWEMARQYLALGLYISLAGPVTFKNARNLHEVAQKVPLDRLMAETDCPYLAPEPLRGQRNEPAFVVNTARRIAELRRSAGYAEDDEIVFSALTENARQLFSIDIKTSRIDQEEGSP